MNILLDKLDFNEAWAFDAFKDIIKASYKVCIIPFAFHEDWMKNSYEWEKFFKKADGQEYVKIATPLYDYGITDNNINLINYFADSEEEAKAKIKESDIIFFVGGFPDKTMDRLKEFNLLEAVEQHTGIIMGWSAGAMMQCYDYFISPDEYYPEFVYKRGLSHIKNFAVEVHYRNEICQNESIERYIRETGRGVYTTEEASAIIVDGDKVTLVGNTKLYQI